MPSATNNKTKSSAHARPSSVGTKEAKETINNGGGSGWTEPPLEQAKPSYEDHGGMPYGVLEDMLPLGQAPNAKIKSRVRAEPSGVKRIVGKNAAGGLVSDTQETPEMTPAFDEPAAASLESATLQDAPMVIFDDDKDQDYMPRQPKKSAKPRHSRSSLARTAASSPAHTPSSAKSTPAPAPAASTPAQQSRPTTAASPVPESVSNGAPASSALKRPFKRSENSPRPTFISKVPPIPNLDAIVDAAVQKSHEANNPALGLALREVHRESLSDDHLTTILAAILDLTATPEQNTEFRAYLTRAKKRVKARETAAKEAAKKASARSNGNSTSSTSSRKSAQAPELVPRQSIEAPISQPKPKISIRIGPHKRPPVAAQSPSRTDRVMSLPDSRPRSGSVSSSSSLSSLTSLDEDAMDVDSEGEAPAQSLAETADLPVMNSNLQVNGSVAGHATLKRTSVEADIDESERALAAKKQKLSDNIEREDRSQASYVRVLPPPQASSNNNAIIPPVRLTANGYAGREDHGREGSADVGSPLTDMSSPPSSQQGTPRTADGPARVIKKKAKTKQSPVKKPTVHTGGETDGSGGRASPVGYDDNEESDNNDFCSSCRGSGYLLCCDGCDRSFHFACLDPPLSQDASELEEPWFCFKCVARRAQPQRQHRGLFSSLLSNLDKRNPSIFSLPQDLREHFEGVTTGKDGRFVEGANGKTRTRAGYDELPDNFRTKDIKGQFITCYHCNLSAMNHREIITCDLCSAHWHLDCLDPPLANAPYRDQWGKKVRDWLCPLHIDQELREMDISRLADRTLERDRKVSMRKPRNAKIVDTNLRRGFINNGLVEVVNDESEEDNDFYDEEVTGVVYRLPEKGIKLDFIDRVKQTKYPPRVIASHASKVPGGSYRPIQPSSLVQPGFVKRSFPEQQIALSLMQFANTDNGMDISSDQVENLIGTLIAEAPDNVVAEMRALERTGAKTPKAKQSTEQERQKLELLQSLISKKLEVLAAEERAVSSDETL